MYRARQCRPPCSTDRVLSALAALPPTIRFQCRLARLLQFRRAKSSSDYLLVLLYRQSLSSRRYTSLSRSSYPVSSPTLPARAELTFCCTVVVSLPFKLIKEYVLARSSSPYVAIGRTPKGLAGALFSAHFFGRCSTSQSRLVFNHKAYVGILSAALARVELSADWVQHVNSNGTIGYWIAPPGTERCRDDLVMLYIHGEAPRFLCGCVP